MERSLGRASVCTLVVAILVATSSASKCGCNPSKDIRPAPTTRSYQNLGDRCEGVSLQDVAASPRLGTIVSFTESFEDFNPAVGRAISLEWTPLAGRQTTLMARGLQPLSSYRMDTECAAGIKTYRWPVDVLAALGLSKRHIGVLASTLYRVGSVERSVLIPLRVSQQKAATRSQTYQLVIAPGARLQEVGFRISRLNADGTPRATSQYQKVAQAYYPAMFPVVVQIRRPAAAGLYLVEVGMTFTSGSSYVAALRFYNSSK